MEWIPLHIENWYQSLLEIMPTKGKKKLSQAKVLVKEKNLTQRNGR